MENASKALIMAGSVLIALMIIGALLLMFNSLSSYQDTGTKETREAQVLEFNNQYETYNRNNVRGSDLYTLLNRVVDYNRRKSTEGKGNSDEGQFLAYENMTIEFTLGSSNDVLEKFSADRENIRLLKKYTYKQDSTSNDFEKDISETVKDLEKEYGANSLNNLAAGISKIFISNSSSSNERKEAIANFNNACKSKTVTDWDSIKEESKIRKDVYTYYEYMQFKRAKFNCTEVKYNEKTGRIVRMKFEFTGEFE